MQLINVVFGDDYEDVDIISVPNFVHDNIEKVTQNFFDWAASTKEHGWFIINEYGKDLLTLGTKEFVKWLNDKYLICEKQEIVILENM